MAGAGLGVASLSAKQGAAGAFETAFTGRRVIRKCSFPRSDRIFGDKFAELSSEGGMVLTPGIRQRFPRLGGARSMGTPLPASRNLIVPRLDPALLRAGKIRLIRDERLIRLSQRAYGFLFSDPVASNGGFLFRRSHRFRAASSMDNLVALAQRSSWLPVAPHLKHWKVLRLRFTENERDFPAFAETCSGQTPRTWSPVRTVATNPNSSSTSAIVTVARSCRKSMLGMVAFDRNREEEPVNLRHTTGLPKTQDARSG